MALRTPAPVADAATADEAVAAFVAGARAATPAQRAGVVAKLRKIVTSQGTASGELPVYKGVTVPVAALQRTIEQIEALA